MERGEDGKECGDMIEMCVGIVWLLGGMALINNPLHCHQEHTSLKVTEGTLNLNYEAKICIEFEPKLRKLLFK